MKPSHFFFSAADLASGVLTVCLGASNRQIQIVKPAHKQSAENCQNSCASRREGQRKRHSSLQMPRPNVIARHDHERRPQRLREIMEELSSVTDWKNP
jgi:hypothetical protein